MADNGTIELRRTNLYAHARFIQFPDGQQQVVRERLVWKGEEGDQFHRVLLGETLPYLAWTYYLDRAGDNAGELWWVLADANDIVNPFDMDSWAGKDLLIPDYDKLQLLL